MDFVGNSDQQVKEILKALNLKSIDELFSVIPSSIREKAPVEDDGLSEWEGRQMMEELSEKNTYHKLSSYLGVGAYDHYIPAVADAIIQKSGFLTSYTPYQAEVSQGTLQATFEFQSAVVALTGLDVANAGVYDGAAALAESALMALRTHRKRKKILLADTIHPHYIKVLEQYLQHHDAEIVLLPSNDQGVIDPKAVDGLLDPTVAAVAIQSPNFYGFVESASAIFTKAKEHKITCIYSSNPLAYGVFASAKELGADIAIGDLQVFGNGLQFGGPYVGYMAARKEYVRQMPGRIVGKTTDGEGRKGYVLTLQAREQHIRREKATSNICTSQALCALASLVTIMWYGKKGVQSLALTNYQRAHYLQDQLVQLGWQSLSEAPFFNEFTMEPNVDLDHLFKAFRKKGIEPGFDLRRLNKKGLVINVTEKKSHNDLQAFLAVAKEL